MEPPRCQSDARSELLFNYHRMPRQKNSSKFFVGSFLPSIESRSSRTITGRTLGQSTPLDGVLVSERLKKHDELPNRWHCSLKLPMKLIFFHQMLSFRCCATESKDEAAEAIKKLNTRLLLHWKFENWSNTWSCLKSPKEMNASQWGFIS